ncbi:hypothetical protein [Gilvibacter sp.]|uniref:hypothetical protein n=1 Tax=Gilvibacter sp. TaxID=2729997 RepID=UPI00345241E5
MQHPIVPGVPGVYIEASFNGHRAVPGDYTFTLKYNGQTTSAEGNISPNTNFNISAQEYQQYDAIMSDMEAKATEMHTRVNMLTKASKDIQAAVSQLKKEGNNASLVADGEALLSAIKAWDEQMIQRRSQAYDDVENFENKFTAEYLFLMNQTNSRLPKVTQASVDLKAEMDQRWIGLKKTADDLINNQVPAYNKKLWDAGIGAINMD